MVVAILTIFVGALNAAAGTQELVVQGILNNQKIPLTGGTLGAVAGALLLSAGVALIRKSPRAASLTNAAAISMLAVTALVGMLGWGLAGWPMTLVGAGVAGVPAVPRAGRSEAGAAGSMTRIEGAFGALVLAQAAHSTEEYIGRLWESFPPARWVTGLVSQDLERGFVAINVALVAFGIWCLVWPIRHADGRRRDGSRGGGRPSRPSTALVHPLWSLRQGGYTPGVATAPILLILALVLARRLRDASATLS